MNMMTVAIEGIDKINTALPNKPVPLSTGGKASGAPSFEEMLQSAKSRPQDINDKMNKDSAPHGSEASHDGASKAADSAPSKTAVASEENDKADAAKISKDAKEGTSVAEKQQKDDIPTDGVAAGRKTDEKQHTSKTGALDASALKKTHKGKGEKTTQEVTTAKDKGEGHEQSQTGVKSAKVRQAARAKADNETAKEDVAAKGIAKDAPQKKGTEKETATAVTDEGAAALVAVKAQNAAGEAVAAEVGQDTKGIEAARGIAPASENGEAAPLGKGEAAKTAKKKTLDKDEKITVSDLRTASDKARVNEEETQSAKMPVKVDAAKGEAEIALNVADTAGQDITSSSTQSAGASSSAFHAMVENSVRENTPEIVKAGSLILRNNNTGTINLVMHPENLGNVRIMLHVSDNVISGQITVHSQEAYNAFKNSSASLAQAFTDSGFQAEGFSVAYSGQGAGQQSSDGQRQYTEPSFMSAKAGRGYDNAAVFAPSAEASYANDYSINVVA